MWNSKTHILPNSQYSSPEFVLFWNSIEGFSRKQKLRNRLTKMCSARGWVQADTERCRYLRPTEVHLFLLYETYCLQSTYKLRNRTVVNLWLLTETNRYRLSRTFFPNRSSIDFRPDLSFGYKIDFITNNYHYWATVRYHHNIRVCVFTIRESHSDGLRLVLSSPQYGIQQDVSTCPCRREYSSPSRSRSALLVENNITIIIIISIGTICIGTTGVIYRGYMHS